MQAEGKPWYSRDTTTRADHLAWLEARLANPLVKILVWEGDRGPLGMVRIDSNGEVAFHADNPVDAIEMLRAAHQYAAEYGGRLKISVDQADRESIRLLQAARFELCPVKFLCYQD